MIWASTQAFMPISLYIWRIYFGPNRHGAIVSDVAGRSTPFVPSGTSEARSRLAIMRGGLYLSSIWAWVWDAGRSCRTHKSSGGGGGGGRGRLAVLIFAPRDAVSSAPADQPGRPATVRFVIPLGQDYAAEWSHEKKQARPMSSGISRGHCVLFVKRQSARRVAATLKRGIGAKGFWPDVAKTCPGADYLGLRSTPLPLPIFFLHGPRFETVGFVHPQLVCRILSDHFGNSSAADVPRRPYAHRLLGSTGRSSEFRAARAGKFGSGNEVAKPWLDPVAFFLVPVDGPKGILSPRPVSRLRAIQRTLPTAYA